MNALGSVELFVVVEFVTSTLVVIAVISLANPADLLAVLPLSLLLHAVFADVRADSVLLASLPLADVFAAVGPVVDAEAVDCVVFPLALVGATIRPNVLT